MTGIKLSPKIFLTLVLLMANSQKFARADNWKIPDGTPYTVTAANGSEMVCRNYAIPIGPVWLGAVGINRVCDPPKPSQKVGPSPRVLKMLQKKDLMQEHQVLTLQPQPQPYQPISPRSDFENRVRFLY